MALTVSTRLGSKGARARATAMQLKRDRAEVKIRPAKTSDATGIADLSTQLGYPATGRGMAVLLRTVSKRKNQKIFVAVLRGTIVGWLEIFRPLSVLNAGKTEIGALVVDTLYRRYGVGTALMREAHEWARQHGSPFIYLRSNVIRKEAHKFYERTGYSIFKTQYVFRKTLTNRKSKVR